MEDNRKSYALYRMVTWVFWSTASWVWLTTLPHCHTRACFNCVNFVSCGHRWTRNPRRHSCTRSWAAVSTTATACCTVSATSCCTSYRSFRTRPIGARKFDHITTVLCELHWLPVRQRIRFKLAMIIYKCLHGLAPPYLADDCVLVFSVTSRWHLRSADTRKLVVRRTRTVTGARNIAVSSAVIWNSLPTDRRVSSLSAATFARHLKACLFLCLAHLRTVYFALYKCTYYIIIIIIIIIIYYYYFEWPWVTLDYLKPSHFHSPHFVPLFLSS